MINKNINSLRRRRSRGRGGGGGMKEKEGGKKDRGLGREGRERRSLLFFLTLPPAPLPLTPVAV